MNDDEREIKALFWTEEEEEEEERKIIKRGQS